MPKRDPLESITGVHIELDPDTWREDLVADPFSVALTSFRMTVEGLRSLLDSLSSSSLSPIDLLRQATFGAVAAASLDVGTDERDALVESIVQLHIDFQKQVLGELDSGAFRPVRSVRIGSDDSARYSITLVGSVDVDDDFTETALKVPLRDLVAPFVPASGDVTTAAAEVGITIAFARSTSEIQRESLLVSAVSSFEAFLSDVIGVMTELNPNLLRASRLTFDARAVLDAQGSNAMIDALRKDFINSNTRSFEALSRFFDNALGLSAPISSLREVVETRNVLVHHRGAVTQQYLRSCEESGFEEGDRIAVGGVYAADCLRRLTDTALEIVSACRSRYLSASEFPDQAD